MPESLTFPTKFHGREGQITHYYGPPKPYKMGEIRKNHSGNYDAFIDGICISMTVGECGARDAITSEFVDDLIRSATEQR
jgi:hypothetical protein